MTRYHKKNIRGRLTFATAGPNTRTTQIFVNFADNSFLDSQGFSPFAEVLEGMDVMDKIYDGYGESEPDGNGPHQGKTEEFGNVYLNKFPKLSYIKKVTLDAKKIVIKDFQVRDITDVPEANEFVSTHRHRALVALAGLVLTSLVVGLLVYGRQKKSEKEGTGPSSCKFEGRELE